MLTEIIILSGISLAYLTHDERVIKKQWKQIMASQSKFTNGLGKTLRILEIEPQTNGINLKVELPYGYTFEAMRKDLETFREGLGYDEISASADGNVILLALAKHKSFELFKVVPLPPNQLLIGDGVIVDQNRFPHMLVGGDTGAGKSRLLLTVLTNLIATTKNEIEIHLLQVRKNDVGVYRNCIQVKTFSKTLEDVLETLKEIDQECQRREYLIDNTKGYYSIADYNKKNEKLKYIYVVIEEFSFLNISRGDGKEEKAIKSECLKYVKSLVNVGRSSGVFLITSLQKPTADSIPADIKAQITTRVSMAILDGPTSVVVLGNEHATKLKEREFICRTLGEQTGQTYTIEHEIVMANIKAKLEIKPSKKPKLNGLAELWEAQHEADD